MLSDFDFRVNNFDFIRLLAALQVLFIHGYHHFDLRSLDWLANIVGIFPGVPIFFVTSGFLISASLEKSPSLTQFFKNRVLRIYPGLWACFLFSCLVVFSVFIPDFEWADLWVWVAAQMTVAQFYNPEFLREYGVGVINGSLWTIPVELQFYFFLPLLMFFSEKLDSKKLVFLGFVLLVSFNIFHTESRGGSFYWKIVGVTALPYLYMFLLGVFLQKNIDIVEKFFARKLFFWLFAFLVLSYVMSKLGFTVFGNYLNPVSAIMLSILTLSAAYSYTNTFSTILRGVDISFGVYIYHMVFVNLFIYVFSDSPYLGMILTVTFTLVLSLLSWFAVEKPALRLKNFSLRSGYK